MNRSKQYINLAIQEAEKSTHKHKMGAIIFKGKIIVSKGYNHSSKSVKSITKEFCNRPGVIHAEVAAILSAKKDLKGYNILVVRINNNGALRLAKPCRYCVGYLKFVGIRHIYYSTNYEIKKL